MSLLGNILAGMFGGRAPRDSGQSAQRMAEWDAALQHNRLPSFVAARLGAAAAGKTPWIATMSAAELGLARRRGIRPLAMVSGTCWYHYGYSWTRGHAEGWHHALQRLQLEARALGANAVLDVKLRRIELTIGDSMDFTLVGTAVRIDGVPAGAQPIVATVPALEFVRLIEADIVPVGIAIGAQYQFLDPGVGFIAQSILGTAPNRSFSLTASSAARVQGSLRPFTNAPLPELGQFWEGIRRQALAELLRDGQRQGTGVLAHTHLGQLLKVERGNNSPPRFLGRHIVIGTVVDTRRASGVPHEIRTVVDMRDALSPLTRETPPAHNAYPVREQEGAI
ncbi:MAG TPA: heavy metal-binding domain-containing protein [Stellaceae bacterium]|nr:heavy metal-binding domain-containing protein [Stellaceae bacterium]